MKIGVKKLIAICLGLFWGNLLLGGYLIKQGHDEFGIILVCIAFAVIIGVARARFWENPK